MTTISPLQQKLAQMLSRLIKIAEEFNVAVYMTNQGTLTKFNYSHLHFDYLHTLIERKHRHKHTGEGEGERVTIIHVNVILDALC